MYGHISYIIIHGYEYLCMFMYVYIIYIYIHAWKIFYRVLSDLFTYKGNIKWWNQEFLCTFYRLFLSERKNDTCSAVSAIDHSFEEIDFFNNDCNNLKNVLYKWNYQYLYKFHLMLLILITFWLQWNFMKLQISIIDN